MKKLYLSALVVLSACLSCSKEIDNTPKEQPQEAAKNTHIATLSFGAEQDPSVKGTFVAGEGNQLQFRWQEGDQIGVYLYSSTLDNVAGAYNVPGQYGPWIAPFGLQSGAGEGTGLFARELNDDLGETYGNVAIYPYTSGSSFAYASDETMGTLTFHLPDDYAGLQNLDMARIPMVAVLNREGGNDEFEFKHVGGAVKVTLKNVPSKAKYFKLTASEGGNISGDFTIALNNVGTGTLQGSGSKNTVQLSLAQGQAAESLTLYFPVPAGTYKFRISVYGDGITYLESFGGANANTIGRGKVLSLPAVTIPDPYMGPYNENLTPSSKASGLTYQVNVYSFADSDGDGIGDFKGIENHLDYFDKLGVTALWLSPSQKAQSYHGYDVTDYTALNPAYASVGPGVAKTSALAEADFQSLINAAHQHNIRIYMDYVINHTGDNHAWFQDVKANGPDSDYWDYYAVSADPYNDVHNDLIPQIPTYWDVDPYNDGRWWPLFSGAGKTPVRYAIDLDWTNASAPTMTVSETTDPVTTSADAPRYLFWGNGTYTQFASNGANKYRLVLDYQSDWGCLVRTTNDNSDWSDGTKWGFASGKDQMRLGVAHALSANDCSNILMPDGTLYFYYSAFSTGMMPDLNYYHAVNCENSPAFQAVLASIDKWLDMGLDGLRLDAIKHIYGNESGEEGSENRLFWQKFYSAVNAKYQAKAAKRSNLTGTADTNIFMVGEVLSGESDCKPFYAGLPAIFEFQFWWDLRDVLKNGGDKNAFVSGICDRFFRHREVRGDAIATPKLSNHDEDRTASVLYDRAKIRLAGAVLLTAPGRPFIYQGEELGYWGEASMGGDEYRRAPILWTTDLSSAATAGVFNKVPEGMLTPGISVQSQAADNESLLTLYRRFAYARNTNPALAYGIPFYDDKTTANEGIMTWKMHTEDDSKWCLVMHNISGSTQTITRHEGEDLSHILVASDPIQVNGRDVTMPPYSSVVFNLSY